MKNVSEINLGVPGQVTWQYHGDGGGALSVDDCQVYVEYRPTCAGPGGGNSGDGDDGGGGTLSVDCQASPPVVHCPSSYICR